MKKFALIGSGISGSFSPALFKAAYNGKYAYELLDGGQFAELFNKFKSDFAAVNVTAPFKEEAFAAADEKSENAQLCQSANMLIKGPKGRIVADNSDFEGVSISIMSALAVANVVDVDDEDRLDEYLAGKRALVVGCGGAGKAAAAACVALGFGSTVILNRSEAKAKAYCAHLRNFFGDVADDELSFGPLDSLVNEWAKADFIIYTLPCAVDALAGIDARAAQFVLEASYTNPSLEQFQDKLHYISGLNWLFNQACVAYEVFTGEAPDEETMKKVW